MSKLQEARQAVAELLENARVGNIIPVRLPGQIEAIQQLLEEADAQHTEQIQQLENRPGGEAGAVLQESAEFVKTALHDLKNPLSSIKGYGDILVNPAMSGELSEMQAQLLDVIRTNTKRMEQLLSDLSTMNKLRGGILLLEDKLDTFKNIVLMIEKVTRPLAESLNRELALDIPQGLPLLKTDGEKLAEALVKLVENGLRYSPEGTGRVQISAHGHDGQLIVVIEDNGVGMTPDDLARLGTLFWRADDDLVRSYKGSGLGIPIAYGLIEQLGGSIHVESEHGVGTRFTVIMPGAN